MWPLPALVTLAPVKFRVAILDDHSAFSEALGLALSACRDIVSIGSAASISGFVELCREHDPDVSLLDYWLRDGTAIDCATQLRSTGIASRLILITGNSTPFIRKRSLDAGFDRTLSKSQTIHEVAQAVRGAAPPMDVIKDEGLSPIEFTPRQQQVLELLGRGFDTPSIADALFISIHTARGHVKAIMGLLDAHSQLGAVTTAIREGYLPPIAHHRSAVRV